MIVRSRDEFLWCELTKEEKAEEKAEFVASWQYETGCTQADASLLWGQYLDQEGYTSRDEEILMRRDRLMGRS